MSFAGFAWGLGRSMEQVGIIVIDSKKKVVPKRETSRQSPVHH